MNTLSWIQPNLFEGIALMVVIVGIPLAIIFSFFALIKFFIIKFKNSHDNVDK